MTSIGILGADRVGADLAGRLSAAGHRVTPGVRNPEGTAVPAAGTAPRIAFADQRTTARTADIVINATPGGTSPDRLAGLRTELSGKLLVDVSNSARDTDDGLPGDPGRQPAWIEDLGGITTARATEAMILVVPHILRRHGFKPFAVSLAR
ncbi:NAD(P)-binding domain-containing protein [Kitasatospora arboriphila]|uniref:Pyrroline-5-carboxylate reductase catalytic N-terminal domain-containing protein n=1 Tax=Kitasatospora arboriphila TaxID=258052 RepID=A0ABN1TKC3_9ACTN